ncbi:MAG: tRNA pseudouridine(38-40) synthase TruA [Spirochaetes bacterium]|nr:tRNA pseudouridine(38-40) synthase TruA [Spirochaetota bacterium]
MPNIKLILSYDGTDFAGFQSQVDQRTIEDELKLAIRKIEKKDKVTIYCAGRTDTGVHAEEQVINFYTEQQNMEPFNWIMAMNSLLPHDIRVIQCELVANEFNARRSAIKREYWYHLYNGPFISALQYRYAAHYPKILSLDKLQQYIPYFIGEHDFTSFCASTDSSFSKVRRIESFFIEKKNDQFIFKITGNAFLHHMIRTIIGTILNMVKNDEDPAKIEKLIKVKDRNQAGPTYYACGLVLKRVYYS